MSYSDFCKVFNSNDFYVWISKLNQIFINCVIKYNGIIVSVVGDTITATFENKSKSLDAINCAIDYQRTLNTVRQSTLIPPYDLTYSFINIFYGQLNYNIEDVINQKHIQYELNSWINISSEILNEIVDCEKLFKCFYKNSETYNSYGFFSSEFDKLPRDIHKKINEWINSQIYKCNLRISTVL